LQERQSVSASFVAFVKRPVVADDVVPLTGLRPAASMPDGRPVVSLAPGTFHDLEPGEEVAFSTPPEPGIDVVAFSRFTLRSPCSVVGVPYEVAFSDYEGANDRLGRLIQLDARRGWMTWQYNIFIPSALRASIQRLPGPRHPGRRAPRPARRGPCRQVRSGGLVLRTPRTGGGRSDQGRACGIRVAERRRR